MSTSLRKTFFNGILYTGISRYFAIFISIGVGAVLARLLTPKEFGLVALVTVSIPTITNNTESHYLICLRLL